MNQRDYSPLDHLLINFDQALRTVAGRPLVTDRPNPAEAREETPLTDAERVESSRLMRINHAGEVSAQALYQGQALTARLEAVRERMEQAAREENDHLDWCEQRVRELGGRTSLLNPFWYLGSFAIGAAAGAIGDKWSLGFVAETERQVERHLDQHLKEVPERDVRTRAILEQMKADEIEHGQKALAQGGTALPAPIRLAMRLTAKAMTRSVYYV